VSLAKGPTVAFTYEFDQRFQGHVLQVAT